MAHRTNVIQVKENLQGKSSEPQEQVTDPVCGRSLDRKAVRNMAFRNENAYYFCSKDCQSQFLSPTYKPGQKKSAA